VFRFVPSFSKLTAPPRRVNEKKGLTRLWFDNALYKLPEIAIAPVLSAD